MTLFAHAGHWAVQLLYLLPIVALIGALALAKWRDPGDAVTDTDTDTDEPPLTDHEEVAAPREPDQPGAG